MLEAIFGKSMRHTCDGTVIGAYARIVAKKQESSPETLFVRLVDTLPDVAEASSVVEVDVVGRNLLSDGGHSQAILSLLGRAEVASYMRGETAAPNYVVEQIQRIALRCDVDICLRLGNGNSGAHFQYAVLCALESTLMDLVRHSILNVNAVPYVSLAVGKSDLADFPAPHCGDGECWSAEKAFFKRCASGEVELLTDEKFRDVIGDIYAALVATAKRIEHAIHPLAAAPVDSGEGEERLDASPQRLEGEFAGRVVASKGSDGVKFIKQRIGECMYFCGIGGHQEAAAWVWPTASGCGGESPADGDENILQPVPPDQGAAAS
jgi:hypothetical protein